MGHASNNKNKWHEKNGEIVAVLAKTYKVRMLEGDAGNQCHNYAFDKVTLVQAPPAVPAHESEPSKKSDDKADTEPRASEALGIWD